MRESISVIYTRCPRVDRAGIRLVFSREGMKARLSVCVHMHRHIYFPPRLMPGGRDSQTRAERVG